MNTFSLLGFFEGGRVIGSLTRISGVWTPPGSMIHRAGFGSRETGSRRDTNLTIRGPLHR